MKKFDNLEEMEQYLDGSLAIEQSVAFEKQMAEDSVFASEVELFMGMRQTIRKYEDKKLKQSIQHVHQELKDTSFFQNNEKESANTTDEKTAKIKPLNSLRRILSIAASVLVLVTAGTFWYANTNFSNNALSAGNYLEADIPGTMGGTNNSTLTFQKALKTFWVEKNVSAAKANFQEIESNSPEYTEAQYFLGHIAFQQQNFSEAIDKYKRVLTAATRPNYINKEKIEWNLLLSRLAIGEDITSDLDQLIQNKGSSLNGQAKDLKKQLDGFWSKLVN